MEHGYYSLRKGDRIIYEKEAVPLSVLGAIYSL